VADGHGYLLRELVVKFGSLLADVIFQVGGVEPGRSEIARKEDAPRLLDDGDNRLVRWYRHRADVIIAFLGTPGLH